MVQLIDLPPEILQAILGFANPEDLAPLLGVCRQLYGFIKGNAALFREIYCRTLVSRPNPTRCSCLLG